MKVIIIQCILIVMPFLSVYSQEFLPKNPEFFKLESPSVASFNKFIDNPISLYNGTPDVNIPIYTLKDGEIELPIALRYNTSGIKTNEESGWVGLGWNLNTGGFITQTIVGGYDGYDSQYKNIVTALGQNKFNFSMPYQSISYEESLSQQIGGYFNDPKYSGKLNPDVFYFTFPGGSGKFVIDYRTDSIFILNREQNIKIEPISESNDIHIGQFKLTTNDGIIHYFQRMFSLGPYTSYDSFMFPRTDLPLSVTFALTQSIYPNGQTIIYKYKDKSVRKYFTSYYYYASMSSQNFRGLQCPRRSDPSYSKNMIFETDYYLESIKTANYSISFGISDCDGFYNAQKLDQVSIARNGTDIYTWKFNYDYFIGENNGEDVTWSDVPWQRSYGTHRLKLNSVCQYNSTETINRYKFTYNNIQLPNKMSHCADYWGYYNGLKGQTSFPDMEKLLTGDNSDVAKLVISKIKNAGYAEYPGYMDRGVDTNFCKAGILTGIEYPTGGYTEFDYESNTFMGSYIPLAKEKTYNFYQAIDQNGTSDVKYIQIIPEKNVKAKLEIRLSKGFNSWMDLKASEVVIVKQPGTAVTRFPLNDDCIYYANHYPDTSELVITKELDLISETDCYYALSASFPDNLGPQNGASYNHGSLTAEISYNKQYPSVTETKGNGLRIKSIKSYEDKTKQKVLLNTEYDYTHPTDRQSSGILHELLEYYRYHTEIRYAFLCDQGNATKPPYYEWANIPVVEISANNRLANPYGTIGGVGYSHVQETKKSGAEATGYTLYEFSNISPIGSTQGSVRIDHPLNGKLKNRSYFDKNNLLVKSEYFFFESTKVHPYFGISVTDRFSTFPCIMAELKGEECRMTNEAFSSSWNWRYQLLAHRLDSYDITLSGKTTTEDGVTVSENYTYLPKTLQVQMKKIQDSDNNFWEYKYFYPLNYSFAPYTTMTGSHILSSVIEEKVYNKNQFVKGSLTKYRQITKGGTTTYVPDKKYFSAITTPLAGEPSTFTSQGESKNIYPYTDIDFGDYTSYFKPQSIAYNNADKVVYLWGYNHQYPIAEIKGATFDEVKNNLGIDPETLAASASPTMSYVDGLRAKIPNAMVTTYTYKPLIGVETVTDPRGVKTTYVYDAFGRLNEIRDYNNNIVETYDYHYKNQ